MCDDPRAEECRDGFEIQGTCCRHAGGKISMKSRSVPNFTVIDLSPENLQHTPSHCPIVQHVLKGI